MKSVPIFEVPGSLIIGCVVAELLATNCSMYNNPTSVIMLDNIGSIIDNRISTCSFTSY